MSFAHGRIPDDASACEACRHIYTIHTLHITKYYTAKGGSENGT